MNRACSILFSFLLFDGCLLKSSSISFTANGRWGPLSDMTSDMKHSNTSLCIDRYMCTPSNLTWIPEYRNVLYDAKSGCKALLDKGITTIIFHGDSYSRQMYAALLITLNGDYRYGSLSNSSNSPLCEYRNQFNEKGCGTLQLNHNGRVCDGKVHLDPLLQGFDSLNQCASKKGSVALWSFGNHRLGGNRHGVNNHTAFAELFEKDICKKLIADKQVRADGLKVMENSKDMANSSTEAPGPYKCSVWWISTHHRMKSYFEDEKANIVLDYNLGMRNFFDSGRCGDVNYIDVFNMTASLAINQADEAVRMTYDGVHWGFEPNLWKAQIILNALMS